jgi:uncharacterized protein YdeI (YjbR/CyaY-like superfamily)
VTWADKYEHIYAEDRSVWRAWLEANHNTARGIVLVYYKTKSDKASVKYDEAVEEALCFGWIDSVIRSIDSERYMQLFTPRKKGSIWSKLNKSRVERVVASGLMTPAGEEVIEAAKADGSWSILDDVDALIVPDDLASALNAASVAGSHTSARDAYDALADSRKKQLLYHIIAAKRADTRARRINQVVRWVTGEEPWPATP